MRALFLLLLTCFGVVLALAQPGPMPVSSIEATVLVKERIFIGTIEEAGVRSNKEYGSVAIFEATETLKGEPVRSHTIILYEPLSKVQEWIRADEPLLVMVFEYGPEFYGAVTALNASGLTVPKSDFSFLRTGREVHEYVRMLVRAQKDMKSDEMLTIPVPAGKAGDEWLKSFYEEATRRSIPGLLVPIDKNLERWAQAHLKSSDLQEAEVAAGSLGRFKSDANIKLFKEALKSDHTRVLRSAEEGLGIEISEYVIRRMAADILRSWGVEFEAPILSRELARYEAVEYIIWQGTASRERLKPLLKMPNLGAMDFQLTTLDYGTMSFLSQIESLTRLNFLGIRGYRDDLLKPLANLPKLEGLFFLNVPVTDAALDDIAAMKSLKSVFLVGTKVSEEGSARLAKARPDLKIDRRSD